MPVYGGFIGVNQPVFGYGDSSSPGPGDFPNQTIPYPSTAGTWTPMLDTNNSDFNAGSGTWLDAFYVRVGQLCVAKAHFQAAANTSPGTGNTLYCSLPFPAKIPNASSAIGNAYFVFSNLENQHMTAFLFAEGGTRGRIANNQGVAIVPTFDAIHSSGTATVANATTSIVVNHNLPLTPAQVFITPTGNTQSASVTDYWADTFTSTQFTIHAMGAGGAGVVFGLSFAWTAWADWGRVGNNVATIAPSMLGTFNDPTNSQFKMSVFYEIADGS